MKARESGFSLIEVMVVMGLMSILALGTMSIAKIGLRAQRSVTAVDDARQLTGEMATLLMDPTACLKTFGGLNPVAAGGASISKIKNAAGAAVYEINTVYGNRALRLSTVVLGGTGVQPKMNLQRYTASSATEGVALAEVDWAKMGEANGPAMLSRFFYVNVVLNAGNKIISCNASGGLADQIWKRNPSDSSKIYYSEGNVGIGTANPTRALDIRGVLRFSDKNFAAEEADMYMQSQGLIAAETDLFLNSNAIGGGGDIFLGSGTETAGATPHLTVKSNGNVGIGTKNPTAQLHIASNLSSSTGIVIANGNSDSSTAPGIRIFSDAGEGSLLQGSSAAPVPGATILRSTTSGGIYLNAVNSAGHVVIATNTSASGPTPRLIVDASGNVGIGTLAPTYKLDVHGAAHAFSFTQPSDIRLKTNVEYLDPKEALSQIASLRGIYYDWKDRAQFGKGRQMGLIAQDVEKAFPEAVTTNSQGFLSVSYSSLVAPVIEAIKELLKTSNKHSREIASVKAENAQLKAWDQAKDQKIKELELKLKQQAAEAKARLDKIEKTLNSK